MQIKPVFEDQASDEVKKHYQNLKNALKSSTLPLFFTYLGAFPEYLAYISEQLVDNLSDSAFNKLCFQLNEEIISQIKKILKKPEETQQWIQTYYRHPSFYHFQQDLKQISLINIKLACIFIALREAIKGWAIAAKMLSFVNKFQQKTKVEIKNEEFIFEKEILRKYEEYKKNDRAISVAKIGLVKKPSAALEKNRLVDYLELCRIDIKQYMKKDYFWTLRVHLERMILAQLSLFPHLIFSPYNVIVSLTQEYDNFYELLYLLSEQFPTLVMQRLMFSGYMMVD